MQTMVTYETRKLTDIKFPMYFSLYLTPGFNMTLLKSFGFESQYEFFMGNTSRENNITNLNWGNKTFSFQGKISILILKKLKINFFLVFQ